MTPEQPKRPAPLSAVVPACNEEETPESVVEKMLALPQPLEVIVADDCTTGRTPEVARRHGLRLALPRPARAAPGLKQDGRRRFPPALGGGTCG